MIRHSSHGFTLIEFIVIISIFAVMAAVALFNFKGFRSNVSLNNLAHDIALTIRQAQVSGGSTLSGGTGGSIMLDTTPAANPIRRANGFHLGKSGSEFDRFFTLYQKTVLTDPFNFVQGVDTEIDTVKIQGPNRIDAIYSAPLKADLAIDPSTHRPLATTVVSDLSIAFSRPRPEAFLFDGSNQIIDNYVGIYIAADADCGGGACKDSHVIIVSRSGEIEVQ